LVVVSSSSVSASVNLCSLDSMSCISLCVSSGTPLVVDVTGTGLVVTGDAVVVVRRLGKLNFLTGPPEPSRTVVPEPLF
jgi:hypothetical protein